MRSSKIGLEKKRMWVKYFNNTKSQILVQYFYILERNIDIMVSTNILEGDKEEIGISCWFMRSWCMDWIQGIGDPTQDTHVLVSSKLESPLGWIGCTLEIQGRLVPHTLKLLVQNLLNLFEHFPLFQSCKIASWWDDGKIIIPKRKLIIKIYLLSKMCLFLKQVRMLSRIYVQGLRYIHRYGNKGL